jgi:hypothetical protein
MFDDDAATVSRSTSKQTAVDNPARPDPEWPRYDPQAPRRIGFLTGGRTEEISADAYAQEHHCALWDALVQAKAP